MRASFLLLACGALVALGCGDDQKVGAVSGVVTLDGKPLANALVSFQPVEGGKNPGPGSNGHTNEKGEYTLELAGGGRGAVIGKHKVKIYAPVEDAEANKPDDDRRTRQKDRVPAKYNTKSTLTQEVKAGANAVNFDLKSR